MDDAMFDDGCTGALAMLYGVAATFCPGGGAGRETACADAVVDPTGAGLGVEADEAVEPTGTGE
jgi:hypothetical protein